MKRTTLPPVGINTATQTALDAKRPAAPGAVAGRYVLTTSPGTTTTGTMSNSLFRIAPWVVERTLAIDRIGAEVTTVGDAGSKIRLGIYADDGNSFPGALLLDAGQIAGDSATVQELTISLTLSPGLYWIGGGTQSVTTTAPTIRAGLNWTPPIPMQTGTSLPSANATAAGFQATIAGALPATFPTSFGIVGSVIRVFVRTA